MEKKRKFLKIIGSIIGCLSICGFSLLFLLDNKKDTQKVSADTYAGTWNFFTVPGYNVKSTYVYTENVVYNGSPTTFRCVWDFDLRISYNISYNYSASTYGYNVLWNTLGSTNYIRTYKQYGDNPIFDDYSLKIGTGPNSTFVGFTFTVFGISDLDLTNATFMLKSIESIGGGFLVFHSSINNRYNVDSSTELSFIDVSTGNNISNSLSYFPTNHMIFDFTFLLDTINSNSNIADSYYEIGYDSGYSTGYSTGYSEGAYDTSLSGVGGNVEASYSQGYADGYDIGVSDTFDNAYGIGYEAGVDSQSGLIQSAYSNGYSVGYEDGNSTDSTVETIFTGIITVGMLPINFFLSIFNFEILGINIGAIVSALLTVAITVVILKVIFGRD